ncbi:MAG: LrgB family protein [Actinomycetes bacterium]
MTHGTVMITIISIVLTVSIYAASIRVRARYRSPLFGPVVLSAPVIMLIITLTPIHITGYEHAIKIITYFLGPATVALAVPFYRNRHVLFTNVVPMVVSLVAGTLASIVGAILLGRVLGLPASIEAALSLKTATAPVAVALAPRVGANPTLVAGLVVLYALIVTFIGPRLLTALRIRGAVARGSALGGVGSGQGVAEALTEGEATGASAVVSMVLAALVVTMIAPPVVHLLI